MGSSKKSRIVPQRGKEVGGRLPKQKMDRTGFAILSVLDLPTLNAEKACAGQRCHTGSAQAGGPLEARYRRLRSGAQRFSETSRHVFSPEVSAHFVQCAGLDGRLIDSGWRARR
jgi:hypothetical protein